MKKISSVFLAKGLLFVLAFTFSCSSDSNSNATDTSSNSAGESSSSGRGSSSSTIGSSSSSIVNSSDSSSSLEQISSSSELSSSSITPSSSSSELQSCDDFVDGTKREHYGMQKKQFCDERDGKKYVYVTIGEGEMAQTWMAENLNFNVSGSSCYSDDNEKCDIYGRLYNWAAAMNISYNCNSPPESYLSVCAIAGKHKGICPNGWHIPSDDEWSNLDELVGGSPEAGKHLKAKEYWNNCTGSENFECIDTRLDDFGFAALPGGTKSYIIGVGFLYERDYGYWWSSTVEEIFSDKHFSKLFSLSQGLEKSTKLSQNKQYSFSARCVKD